MHFRRHEMHAFLRGEHKICWKKSHYLTWRLFDGIIKESYFY